MHIKFQRAGADISSQPVFMVRKNSCSSVELDQLLSEDKEVLIILDPITFHLALPCSCNVGTLLLGSIFVCRGSLVYLMSTNTRLMLWNFLRSCFYMLN